MIWLKYKIMNWIVSKLFPTKQKVKELTVENESLQAKLDEKQDVINKTNAYWKREMAKLRSKKTISKNL